MIKKIAKWVLITLVVLVIALVATPFLFKDKVKELVKQTINDNLEATVTFSDVDLSLFTHFPKATIIVDSLVVINKAPFAGDTLFAAQEIEVSMSIKELFKNKKEAIKLDYFELINAKANVIFNEQGLGNFDIALKTDEDETPVESQPFSLDIEAYKVENLKLVYEDKASKMKMVLDQLNHTGKGNFAEEVLDLTTETTALLSFDMDGASYMKNMKIALEAVLGLDLKNSKYTFKDNKAKLNELPLEFNGFLQLLDEGQLYDLSFKTPTSSFKNFLGLVPEAYAANLNDVKTEGDFKVSGTVNGKLTDITIPKFNIDITSNNAMFKFADLPKAVQNIHIDTHIVNQTGLLEDTYVDLNKLSFTIDKDAFNASAKVRNMTTNPLINAKANGVINLANVEKAYPLKLDNPLTGILKADVALDFDMKSIEEEKYERVKNAGTASLTGFKYEGAEMAKPFLINKAALTFNPSKIQLNEIDAKTGDSDLNVRGTLENFYGFMLRNETLKGNFTLNSNQLIISDFMTPSAAGTTETTSKTAAPSEAVKIPSFLDCNFTANAIKVVYDNLTLSNVSGNMGIKDEAIDLKNLKMGLFGGTIGLDGLVSTKGATPTFKMKLGLDKLNITESFTHIEMLKKIAPIANVIKGKLNSTIELSGNLTNEMMPDMKSLTGDLMGQLLDSKVDAKDSKVLNALTSNLKFLDVSKINLDNVKALINFKDGKVNIKPFTLKHQDVAVEIGGTHGFDQLMNYNLKFDVPAKYLGTEVNNYIAKLTPKDATALSSIPVSAILGGSFAKPTVSTDLKQATTGLVSQLIKQQKDALIGKGTSKLSELIDKNRKPGDTTKTVIPTTVDEAKEAVKDKAKEELEKAKEKAKEDLKNKAKEGLNSLFGGKKKE